MKEPFSNKHVYDVASIRIHEKYMTHGYGFDVALVKLARPALFKPGKVWPACLPKKEQRVPVGTECFITGKSESMYGSVSQTTPTTLTI